MGLPGGWELFAILAVVVLLFGATKLPQMARSLGQSARVFKAETRGMKSDEEAAKNPEQSGKSDPQQLTSGESGTPQASTSIEDTEQNKNQK